jgi:hypothetical protein
MPGAAKAVKLPFHFPVFHADLSVAVIIPLYAMSLHIRKSTALQVDEPSNCFSISLANNVSDTPSATIP